MESFTSGKKMVLKREIHFICHVEITRSNTNEIYGTT